MIGLLTKDFHTIMIRRQTLLMFIGICVLMGISMDGTFIVGYMVFLGLILAVGTYSFDEADNGLVFLLTLPVTRKQYVQSKYLFGLLLGTCAWILSLILLFLCNYLKGIPTSVSEELLSALVILPIGFILLDIMLPFQIRYGAERSRLILAVCAGAVVAIAAFFRLADIAGNLPPVSDAVIVLFFYAAAVIATVISLSSSCRILEKKDL